jgi:hypothetical protein
MCALGNGALGATLTASYCTAVGSSALALSTADQNTALGALAGNSLTTGTNVTCVGYNAQPSSATATNEVSLGSSAVRRFRVPGIGFDTFEAVHGTVPVWDNTQTKFLWKQSGTFWALNSTNYFSVVAGSSTFVDTSANTATVVLPATANMGDVIKIIDGFGNANVNNITINPNGLKILGSASNYVLNTAFAAVELVYFNATSGWVLTKK